MTADFTKSCSGCERLFDSPHVGRDRQPCTAHRCGQDGFGHGYIMGIDGRFLPWVPAWCRKGDKNGRV